MQKAIVIGSSSGIGKALAKVLACGGYSVGLVARRLELLLELQKEIETPTYVKQIDVTRSLEAQEALKALLEAMGDVDLIVLNAGVFFHNEALDWEKGNATLQVNVVGFAALASAAMEYFQKRGKGHLVGISSISALRGESSDPFYSGSKAFVSNFLEGLRVKTFKKHPGICITDIQPGWIDTAMAQGEETFWMASPEKAAEQIYRAIQQKRPHAYISRRWRLYAWLLKLSPRWVYHRISF